MSVHLRFGAGRTAAPVLPTGAIAFTSSATMVRAAVRAAVSAEIERLIAVLDAMDEDPDLEPNGDREPALGWPEGELRQIDGVSAADDCEDDAGDDREPDEDREPILGWTAAENQVEAGASRFGDSWQHDEDEESAQPAVTPSPDKPRRPPA